MIVRDATEVDLVAIVDIYNQVVATTSAIWRDTPVSVEDRSEWLAGRRAAGYPVLVAVEQAGPTEAVDGETVPDGAATAPITGDSAGTVIGFGSFGAFRPFPGYHLTVEHSIHVAAGHRGSGVGHGLMEALLLRAEAMGKAVMVAGVDGDNLGSIRFHQRYGFVETGRMPGVGRRFGQPLDLVLMQRPLGNR
ncbi:MAG: N-acetyltransferase family protein [Aquihabitans sp.]